MAIVAVQLNFPNINISAQVGDIAYFSTASPTGGFDNSSTSTTFQLGPILQINPTSILVQYDDTIYPSGIPIGSYISFAKNKLINTSSLVGYFASVEFVNDSSDRIELFSIGSEVSSSSK